MNSNLHNSDKSAIAIPEFASKEENMTIAFDFYLKADLSEILDTISSTPLHMPTLESVLSTNDTNGILSREIFLKICRRNPRLGLRYDNGRLCSKSERSGDGVAYNIVLKENDIVLHIYHDDQNGSWIRDVYELDSSGSAKFHSYVTEANDGRYETDVDLAISHGSIPYPKIRNYSGFIPLSIHNPISHTSGIKKVVDRILATARL